MPQQRQTIDVLPVRDQRAVSEVAQMTSEIRRHSEHIESIASRRRRKIQTLRKRGVTLRVIASTMNVSIQAVQKILAEDKNTAAR
jgi:hypothetical protein